MHIGTRMVLLEYQRVFGSSVTKKKLTMPLAMPEKSEISGFSNTYITVYTGGRPSQLSLENDAA